MRVIRSSNAIANAFNAGFHLITHRARPFGLRNLPFKSFAANQTWIAMVELAMNPTAWLQTIALHDEPARRWEPKRFGCACSRYRACSPATPEEPPCICRSTCCGTTVLITAIDRLAELSNCLP